MHQLALIIGQSLEHAVAGAGLVAMIPLVALGIKAKLNGAPTHQGVPAA